MKILIIDGQGGKIGRQLVEALREKFPRVELLAVGTNSIATSAMIKGGAVHAATGENAVKVACSKADLIVGPIGIVIADSLYGEITPGMSVAVGQSSAVKILIPINKCENIIVGSGNKPIGELLEEAVGKISEYIDKF